MKQKFKKKKKKTSHSSSSLEPGYYYEVWLTSSSPSPLPHLLCVAGMTGVCHHSWGHNILGEN